MIGVVLGFAAGVAATLALGLVLLVLLVRSAIRPRPVAAPAPMTVSGQTTWPSEEIKA